jgi:hypothetical protein
MRLRSIGIALFVLGLIVAMWPLAAAAPTARAEDVGTSLRSWELGVGSWDYVDPSVPNSKSTIR